MNSIRFGDKALKLFHLEVSCIYHISFFLISSSQKFLNNNYFMCFKSVICKSNMVLYYFSILKPKNFLTSCKILSLFKIDSFSLSKIRTSSYKIIIFEF